MTKAKRPPNTTIDGKLACAFGELWIGPHPLCRAETARICGSSIEEVPDHDLSHLKTISAADQLDLFGAR